MASEDLRIIVSADGADTAARKIRGVQDAVGTQNSGLTGAVFKANIAIEALRGVLNLAGGALDSFAGFLSESSSVAADTERTMIGLSLAAKYLKLDVDDVTGAAQELSAELNLGIGASASSLQNLLKAGLNLDQATDLMRRFTNEAIIGKRDVISLDEAVQNITFAYKTNNSVLGDLSGFQENFGQLIEEGRESLIAKGHAVEDITDEMAKYEGVINRTNDTLGASEALTGTLTHTQTRLGQENIKLQQTVGNALNPVLNAFLQNVALPGITILRNLAERGIKFLQGVLEDARPYIDIIKESIREFFSIIVGSPVGSEVDDLGRSLKEAFRQELIDLIRDVAIGTKDFVEYLKSPQGKLALENTAALIRLIGDAIQFVISSLNELNAVGGNPFAALSNNLIQQNSVTTGRGRGGTVSYAGSQSPPNLASQRLANNVTINIQGGNRGSSDDFMLINSIKNLNF